MRGVVILNMFLAASFVCFGCEASVPKLQTRST